MRLPTWVGVGDGGERGCFGGGERTSHGPSTAALPCSEGRGCVPRHPRVLPEAQQDASAHGVGLLSGADPRQTLAC